MAEISGKFSQPIRSRELMEKISMFKRTSYQFGNLDIKPRKNGLHVWVYRYRTAMAGGRRKQVSLIIGTVEQYPTKAQAWKASESLRLSANPDNPQATQVTFRALAEKYRTDELPELRHSTQLAYSSYLDTHILPKWGDYSLDAIKPFAVEQWLKTLSLARKTKGSIHNLMRLLFNAAMRWEFMNIQANPMRLVRVKGVSKREKEPRVLTLPECHRLLGELEEPYRTMVALGIATGLRCSELFGLKWGDFDWANSTMFVRRAIVDGVVDEVKTKYSKAGLPLDPALAAVMLRWKAQSKFTDDGDWVFASWRTLGKKPLRSTSVLENVLKPAAERAGLGLIGWHTFRRTFSTLLRGNGEDIKVQQELMRHADIRTTMNLYTQANSDQKRQAQGKIVQMVLVKESEACSPMLPRPSGTC
jgi:integrase